MRESRHSAPQRPTWHFASGIRLALLLLASLWPLRVYVPRLTTHLIGAEGDVLLLHLHCAWQWESLGAARLEDMLRLPTMYPYSSGLAFGEPLLGITLPFAPIFLATGNSVLTFNLAVAGSFMLLGLAVFLWSRDCFESDGAALGAALLVVYTPWRLHYLSAINVLTVHFAVFGLWLLYRWLREARIGFLAGSGAAFYLQIVTSTQVAIAAGYLALIWLGVYWACSGMGLERQRIRQLGLVGLGGLLACLPWLTFYEEAFGLGTGVVRTKEMYSHTPTTRVLLEVTGLASAGGAYALAGLGVALWMRNRSGLGACQVRTLIGLGTGCGLLLLLALGPYTGPEHDPTPLPGYFASRFLPLVGMLRAPVRLAALTPVVLALLASAGFAVLRQLAIRHLPASLASAWWLLALSPVLFLPELRPATSAPIHERPNDLRLAQTLADLPEDAVILTLPMKLNHVGGSAVDERVLVHGRAQVGGFASLVPLAFRHAQRQLGQWPSEGMEVAQALGVSHLVVPRRWLEDSSGEVLSPPGHDVVAELPGRVILRAEPRPVPERAGRLRVPGSAAAGAWLTLAYSDGVRFHPREHLRVAATWQASGSALARTATVLYPGISSAAEPILIHVPTPATPGVWLLRVEFPEQSIEATVQVLEQPTTRDEPVREIMVQAAARPPVRVASGFSLDVDLHARGEMVLLATSLESLPYRHGATALEVQYRSRDRVFTARMRPRDFLPGDLAPGDRVRHRWYLKAPPRPGQYDIFVRLVSTGLEPNPMPWRILVSELDVLED